MQNTKHTCGYCARRNCVADYEIVCKYCNGEFWVPEHIENHCDNKETEERIYTGTEKGAKQKEVK